MAHRARAQARPLRIGVLGDPGGYGAGNSGPPVVEAVKMAVADAGGMAADRPVEILAATFSLRPDDALGLARSWFERDDVSALVDIPGLAASLAVQRLATSANRVVLNTGSLNPDLSTAGCSPVATQWAPDTTMAASTLARGIAGLGAARWFLVLADTTLGLLMQRDAVAAIRAAGGTVVGAARRPEEAVDFASAFAQARDAGAQVVGLCDFGPTLVRQLAQARQHGAFDDGRMVASFLGDLAEIRAAGIGTAQRLMLASGFYWNESPQARAFGLRFQAATGRMPGISHAAAYAATRHYLRCLGTAEQTGAIGVNQEMRRVPAFIFGRTVRIRLDGRAMLDMTMYRARASDGDQPGWNLLEKLRSFPPEEVIRPMQRGTCGGV